MKYLIEIIRFCAESESSLSLNCHTPCFRVRRLRRRRIRVLSWLIEFLVVCLFRCRNSLFLKGARRSLLFLEVGREL